MFGYVNANLEELTEAEKVRYNGVYCGICRRIRTRQSNMARLGLNYDMAFLALLEMSLYEPEESGGDNACILHPVKKRPWIDNSCVEYAADMNIALAYYNCMDDWEDDRKVSARAAATVFQKAMPQLRERYPRQCREMETCIRQLRILEQENCASADEPANCFGRLMAELLVFREDRWEEELRQVGFWLGRFIYLTDAAVDYRRDRKRNRYNPFLAMETGENFQQWEQYLVLAMARCTEAYERLPLVQDKSLLDNILYSGVWTGFRHYQHKREGGKT